MKVVLQRVRRGSVTVGGEKIAEIGLGLVMLVGIGPEDSQQKVMEMAEKTALLRIFEDEQGKINRSLLDVGGEALVVSQFTLYADTRRGRRPSFTGAGAPELARSLVEAFAAHLQAQGVRNVQSGEFGAEMLVEILNDGPVTVILDC
jgi:D-tyrosyl-tRNA(Tyr) deacylase